MDDSDKQHYKLRLQLIEPKVENFSVEPIMDLGVDEKVEERPRMTAKTDLSPAVKKLKTWF